MENVITHDGTTAISQLIDTAFGQCELLTQALDADAEAMRILSAEPAMSEAFAAADREYAASMGGCKAARRWDERDEQRWAWLRGYTFEFCPAPSRVESFLSEWGQRVGFVKFDQLFQTALNDAREDGTARAVSEKLQQLYDCHRKLLSVANALAEHDPPATSRSDEWLNAVGAHNEAVNELLPYAPPPTSQFEQADAAETFSDPVTQHESTNEARDAWMYAQKNGGKTHSQIRHSLEKEHADWDYVVTDQGIGRAIDRYSERRHLPILRRKKQ